MPSLKTIGYMLVHPNELRNIIQWFVWHQPVHERDESQEPETLKQCFKYLDLTSRSFSAVIKELNPELLVPVCLFYLILRGLDTIEDDMTIPIERKAPLLIDFHNIIEQEGWTFTENGPNEKDRELLVHFDNIVTELLKVKPAYRAIIKDITRRMGLGMAEYQQNGMVDYRKEKAGGTTGLTTIDEYEVYCHHVAGLVGEGLTRLFVESGLANPALLKRADLHESMGQFLQQVNIIRDIREDYEDSRRFWPKDVWSKYVDTFDDLFKPENRELAMRCSSEMILIALDRADDCLFYLAGIRDQSVFNFAAIPQSMAIATLELCLRNPAIFDRNVKITKGDACRLMIQSSQNLQILYETFREHARRIHKKNDPRDPNFLRISVACGRIEQFIESIYPTQQPTIINPDGSRSPWTADNRPPTADEIAEMKAREASDRQENWIMVGAVATVLLIITVLMIFLAWMGGARFDLMFASVKNFIGRRSTAPPVPSLKHGEL